MKTAFQENRSFSTALFIISCLFVISGYADRQYHTTNLIGGLALAPNSRPGVHFALEPSMLIHTYIGLGLNADYSWISPTEKIYKEDAGVHFIGLAPVLKAYLELEPQKRIIGEIDPGLVLAILYQSVDGEMDIQYTSRFGLTLGAGFNFHRFLVGFRFKSVFSDVLTKNIVDYGTAANWFCIYVGYAGS
jgi:hypothetical protein